MPKIATCNLKSEGPYIQGKAFVSQKEERETHEEYEKRSWKERCHVTDKGNIFIPASQFSNSLKNAAGYLSMKIKGQGPMKYTQKFKSGTMVIDDLILPLNVKDVEGRWQFVPSDGKKGGSTRVHKCFPEIPSWEGAVTYYIIDDIITEEVFKKVLIASGVLIGIGVYRPQNGGTAGRFSVQNIEWSEYNV